ncbi:DUF3237 domain-containing protein [Methylobacterium terricola]|uniref:UPF0311 protein FF100_28775 n=1 Tax=Methylobacterium terricola TaxID=2583531 RepID=A0A5C4LAX1_9HYPH|nr:DUF3237 domain-containing protein [Methylobacterium terricola]TNC08603.1 DUF3237 domain-containing protein [Methylobacterium terricola]
MPDRDALKPDRRALLLAGAGLALTGPAFAAETSAPLTDLPLAMPKTEFVYEAVVEIAPMVPLGESPLGERRIVPITGGVFQGPRIRGTVLPGGADRQLVRKDGVRRLDALYEMKTEDGAILTVRNQVLVDPGRDGAPDYRFSTIDVTAPEGPHAWLNRLVLVGTLASLRPAREAVLVRAFRLA